MKLKSIALTEHDVEGSVPETVTVELTAREAAFLAKLTGKQRGVDANAVMAGGDVESSAIYACLAYEVANRFFEDGVDDWVKAVKK